MRAELHQTGIGPHLPYDNALEGKSLDTNPTTRMDTLTVQKKIMEVHTQETVLMLVREADDTTLETCDNARVINMTVG